MKLRFTSAAAAALLLASIGLSNSVHAQSAADSLAIAVMSNDAAMVRSALDAGVGVNENLGQGRTPLITAVIMTRPEAVKTLLERGANPNLQADDGGTGNALTAAFFAGNGSALLGWEDHPDPSKSAAALEVLRLIAARHPDFNFLARRAMTQMTALMMAAEMGAVDAVKVLLDAGASPNFANGGKYTALDYAVDRAPVMTHNSAADRVEVVRLLLAAGAQTQRKGADGLSPVDRARRSGNQAVVSMLTASRG
ncbi:MAG TPA: ankyrin repeat domain-containing protein [Povalibacter sp.]